MHYWCCPGSLCVKTNIFRSISGSKEWTGVNIEPLPYTEVTSDDLHGPCSRTRCASFDMHPTLRDVNQFARELQSITVFQKHKPENIAIICLTTRGNRRFSSWPQRDLKWAKTELNDRSKVCIRVAHGPRVSKTQTGEHFVTHWGLRHYLFSPPINHWFVLEGTMGSQPYSKQGRRLIFGGSCIFGGA